MKTYLSFEDILIPDNYLKLQNQFKYYDDRFPNEKNFYSEIQIDDFDIIYSGMDPVTGENLRGQEFFIKDYLIPKLEGISARFTHKFQETFDRLRLENGNIELFYNDSKDSILENFSRLDNCDYLSEEISIKMEQELDYALEYLQNTYRESTDIVKNRIPFCLNRQDLLVFFLMLRHNKLIQWKSYQELKVLLETNVELYNSETREISDLVVHRTHLSDYVTQNRPVNKSIERLKATFMDENFYNIF